MDYKKHPGFEKCSWVTPKKENHGNCPWRNLEGYFALSFAGSVCWSHQLPGLEGNC